MARDLNGPILPSNDTTFTKCTAAPDGSVECHCQLLLHLTHEDTASICAHTRSYKHLQTSPTGPYDFLLGVGRWEPDPPLKSFVKGPLDGYMGIVVPCLEGDRTSQ